MTGAPARSGGRKLPRNLWVVTLTSFLTDISSEMLFNLVPLYLFNVLGVRTGIIGLIEGVAEATSSILKLVSGWISDRLRMRKRIVVLGYSLSALAKPFLYVASHWGAVMAVRFADRVGKGLRTAPRDALLADSVRERRRGFAFGLHRAGDTAGAVLGLGIAALILRQVDLSAKTLTRAAFQTVVLASLVPALLAVLVMLFGAREVPPRAAETQSEQGETARAHFPRSFRIFMLVLFIFTLGNSSDAFLILRAETLGLSVFGVLGVLLVFNLVYALVATPAGALSDRIGRRTLLVMGWLLYGLVYLGFALAGQAWQVWVLMALYGGYYGMTEGVAKAYVADMIASARRGRAYGVYNTVVGLTALPASAIAGILWQGLGSWAGFGPGAPFLFGAGLSMAASLMTVLLLRESIPLFDGEAV
jgi:MFS family permease